MSTQNDKLKKFHRVDEDTEATIHVKKGLGRRKEREEKETAEIKGRRRGGSLPPHSVVGNCL